MRGRQEVIDQLNAALSSEMTAVVQYMVQAETCESWATRVWLPSPRRER
jgi:bacterioferritin (cytochrome b1)